MLGLPDEAINLFYLLNGLLVPASILSKQLEGLLAGRFKVLRMRAEIVYSVRGGHGGGVESGKADD